ncbi:hypothetical protein [Fictibacillus terranigra]|uniref:Uncharacterized protein n=1 Tax=Fictibacillus terranigra TaxID=3058424 RepID=A0ABT8EAA4_9BACL|nr:hypothetical protein [Fictibacillus sp. CENA-BCM004]MDN4074848.1 hypothetical protein [Fictibacillus sp. CENA-BCM004]
MKISIRNVNVESITMKGSLNIGKTLIIKRYGKDKNASNEDNKTPQKQSDNITETNKTTKKTKTSAEGVQIIENKINKTKEEKAEEMQLANASLLYYILITLLANNPQH